MNSATRCFGLSLGMIAMIAASKLIAAAPLDGPGPFDPIAALGSHYEAVTIGDGDAALAPFGEGAQMARGTLCPPAAPCIGSMQILQQLETEIRNQTQMRLISAEVRGATVSGRVEFRGAPTRNAGIDRVIFLVIATFEGREVTMLDQRGLDLSDPLTVQFAELQDLATVFQNLWGAIGRGDVEGAVGVFAEDALLAGIGLCMTAPCEGRDAIRDEMARLVADGTMRASLGTAHGSGGVHIADSELHAQSITTAGAERVIVSTVTEISAGQIQALRVSFDLADPQTVAYLASR